MQPGDLLTLNWEPSLLLGCKTGLIEPPWHHQWHQHICCRRYHPWDVPLRVIGAEADLNLARQICFENEADIDDKCARSILNLQNSFFLAEQDIFRVILQGKKLAQRNACLASSSEVFVYFRKFCRTLWIPSRLAEAVKAYLDSLQCES